MPREAASPRDVDGRHLFHRAHAPTEPSGAYKICQCLTDAHTTSHHARHRKYEQLVVAHDYTVNPKIPIIDAMTSEYRILECDTVLYKNLLKFQKNILPPSSG
jgi:hypothetical protein